MCKSSFVFILVLLMHVCGPLFAQAPTPMPGETESAGILQRLAERASEAKHKIENIGGALMGFAGTYYEDHIQPVTDEYVEWASNARKTFWEKLQTTLDNYNPYKSTSPANQPPQG